MQEGLSGRHMRQGAAEGGKSRGSSEESCEEGVSVHATRKNPQRHLCLFPLLQLPPLSPLPKRHMRQSQGSIQGLKVRSAML